MNTKYVKRPGGTLACSDYGGSGEPVLMLPGLGALRSEYRFLAPQLCEAGYRAVTADLRGHGESSVPWDTYDVPSVGRDVLSMIEHLDAGAAHLVGTSFAGAAVVWAAAERPDQVRSLVLINPFASEAELSPSVDGLFWLMKHSPRRVCVYTAYYRSLYPTHRPGDFEEYLDRLRGNMAEQGRMEAAAALAFSSREPSDERLERVTAPTLVIMGGKDPDFADPAEEGTYIAEKTGGKLALIDGAGHYPQTEMPEKTASIVVDFLNYTGL
jgi:pimeloyl-ACP methyl ester carboxylesterase